MNGAYLFNMEEQKPSQHTPSQTSKKAVSEHFNRSVLKREYLKNPPIRETEWTRTFEWGESTVIESKFMIDGLEIPAHLLKKKWPRLAPSEKLDFVMAYMSKPSLTDEDEQILDYLMGVNEPDVWIGIAVLLPQHSNRDRVLTFLQDRLTEDLPNRSNYFQALELMSDKRALPALRAAFDRYNAALQAIGLNADEFDYGDYLSCCRALWVLDGSAKYKEAIETLARSDDISIRSFAQALLKQEATSR